ncbi:hypothetical protein [Dongia rigui]|uniref:Uncharacterized protein n=1 Tax=Dongia rigui TaxID=940149 RepID=A0ABU5E531_9PROT|nr:hypothetical protein [Dongia rigui]MDY0873991.1 hypothetical protein [Dongia rigui]
MAAQIALRAFGHAFKVSHTGDNPCRQVISMWSGSKIGSWFFNVAIAAFCLLFTTSVFVHGSQANSDTISIEVSPAADFLVLDGEKKKVDVVDEPERSRVIAEFGEEISKAGGWGDIKGCEDVLAFDVEFGFRSRIVGSSCALTGEKAGPIAICLSNTGSQSWSALSGPIAKSELIEFMARECALPEQTISAEGDVMWSGGIE